MNLQEIRERYVKFLEWNNENLDEKLLKISGEYAYFQSLYYETVKKINIVQKNLDELWTGKFKWYKHEFEITLTNNEIKSFIEKDNEIIQLNFNIKKLNALKEFLMEALKNINQLRWDIKSYIEWKKFQAGLV